MKITQILRLSSPVLAVGLLVNAVATTDAAESVPQFFAEWMPADSTGSCIDWEARDSKRVVAAGTTSDMIEFITPNGPWTNDQAIVRNENGKVLIDLRGTRWIQLPVIHVAESGVEKVRLIYWLVEDLDGDGELDFPSPGMTASTGANGNVLNVVQIRLSRVSSTDSWGNANKFYISPNGQTAFCIAIGRFQK